MLRDRRGELLEVGDEIAIERGLINALNIAKIEDVSVTMAPIPMVELLIRVVVPAPEGNMQYALKLSKREKEEKPEGTVHLA